MWGKGLVRGISVVSASLCCLLAYSDGQLAKVVRVVDGDTLAVRMLDSGKSERVRLTGIDAPELAQAGGPEAKAALTKWAEGKTVWLGVKARDKYHRLLADVWCGRSWLNKRLVETGNAWGQGKGFHALQGKAAVSRLGLWGGSAPTMPSDFRRFGK